MVQTRDVIDLRALIESEAVAHRRTERLVRSLFSVIVFLALTVGTIGYLGGKSFASTYGIYFPLLFVGGIAIGYKPRHLKALQEAITDPDPTLDAHFAAALSMEHMAAAEIGRRAFLERFGSRAPCLNPEQWRVVARSLQNASVQEAEGLLRLLRDAGEASTLDPMEAFASSTSVDRLRTAARRTLGDVRLHVARERVLASERAGAETLEAERLRIGL